MRFRPSNPLRPCSAQRPSNRQRAVLFIYFILLVNSSIYFNSNRPDITHIASTDWSRPALSRSRLTHGEGDEEIHRPRRRRWSLRRRRARGPTGAKRSRVRVCRLVYRRLGNWRWPLAHGPNRRLIARLSSWVPLPLHARGPLSPALVREKASGL